MAMSTQSGPHIIGERVPRLHEEPEIVKFCRTDSLFYVGDGDWDPEKYDPDVAVEIMETILEDIVEAERLGFDGLTLTEHHFDAWTIAPSPNVLLAAAAMRTTRMRLGQSVSILPMHSAWRLAEEAGMLDILSNGRAEIGFGKGSFVVERERYGITAEEADERFDEGLELITRALSEIGVTFKGRYNRIDMPSTVYPKPFGEPLRPWIAGFRPDSVAKIGRDGHNLYGMISPYTRDNFRRYAEAAEAAGHERTGANYMASVGLIVAPTDREAEQIYKRAIDFADIVMEAKGATDAASAFVKPVFTGAMHGSPSTIVDKLGEELQLSGARRLNVVMRTGFINKEHSRQTMHLFAEEVMPHLRNLPA